MEVKTWKDTVIKTEPHSMEVVCPHCGEDVGVGILAEGLREEQAERTESMLKEQWKQEGIREVDKFIQRHTYGSIIRSHHFSVAEWQAQLKKWGLIKEGELRKV